jgi:hypothetical protein
LGIKKSKFLVITARVDESQFNDLVLSLCGQKNVTITHKVVTGLDTIAAETALYNICKEFMGSHDYVIKLDADMVVKNEAFMEMVATFFERNKLVNRISLPVNDFFTGQQIMGVHSFRASAVPSDRIIKEPSPDKWIDSINGLYIVSTPTELVSHGFAPTVSQAVRFGLHRAFKSKSGGYKQIHWLTLESLFINWKKQHANRELSFSYFASIEVIENFSMYDWSVVDSASELNKSIHKKIDQRYKEWCEAGSRIDAVPDFLEIRRKEFPSIRKRLFFMFWKIKARLQNVRGRLLWKKYFL